MALRSNNNRDVSNHTLPTGNKHRTLPGPEDNLAKICRHGNPVAAEGDLEVAAGVVNQDAAPARPKNILAINDNYCLLSPEPMARPVNCVSNVQRQNFHVSVQKPVLCPVVSPVPFVLKVRGQSQKKDGSPSSKVKTEIIFVKSVFFCRSLCFCPHCSKCPQCCQCSDGVRASAKFLAEVVLLGCKSESSIHPKGRLHSPVQKQTSSGKKSLDSRWLCKPPQEPLPEGGFACLTTKEGNRDGEGSNISSLLQQTFHSSQTKPKMAANLGPQFSKQIFERKNIQNGNPRDNSDFLVTREMGDIAGLKRHLFPHSSSHSSFQVLEISRVPLPKSVPISSGPFPLASQQLRWSSLVWSKRSS